MMKWIILTSVLYELTLLLEGCVASGKVREVYTVCIINDTRFPNGRATRVNVSLTLSKMVVVCLKSMEVEYDLMLHHRWVDDRLSSDSTTRKMAVAGAIWKPKLTFTQGVVLRDPDEATQYWRGTADGRVLYSERLTLRTDCSRKLEFFPFDTQTCYLKIGTYRFPNNEVQLTWEAMPVTMLADFVLDQFHIADVAWYSETEIRPSGNFSVLVAQLVLSRLPQHYVSAGMIPAALTVVMTYLVFWMHTSELLGRLLLCCGSGLMLGLCYMTCSVPPTAYVKAFDVWFGACAAFIFVSLIETVAVESMTRTTIKELKLNNATRTCEEVQKLQWLAMWADRASRALVPLGFISFTIVFCTVYVV